MATINRVMQTYILMDKKVFVVIFIDGDCTCHHSTPRHEVKNKTQVEVINGKSVQLKDITYLAMKQIIIQDPNQLLKTFVTKLRCYSIIFIIP